MKIQPLMKTMSLGITKNEKMVKAIDLMIHSLFKPDSALRTEAMEEGCYKELMYIRNLVRQDLKTQREALR